jgi:hypothetical protein
MQHIEDDENTEGQAVKIAEYREWPDRLNGEEGPDALRYPGLYDATEPGDEDEDLEPLDLQQRERAR